MTHITETLGADRGIRQVEVPSMGKFYILKMDVVDVITTTGRAFHLLQGWEELRKERGKPEDAGLTEVLDQDEIVEMIEGFRRLALKAIVWGPNDEGHAPDLPCLNEGLVRRIKLPALPVVGQEIMAYAGFNEEAGQLAEHFSDENGDAGGDPAARTGGDVREKAERTPSGQSG